MLRPYGIAPGITSPLSRGIATTALWHRTGDHVAIVARHRHDGRRHRTMDHVATTTTGIASHRLQRSAFSVHP
jgi:hypothetical protein